MDKANRREEYNDRLFSGGGLRAFYHLARFRWFRAQVTRRGCQTDSVLELGCFDGKILDFTLPAPSRYLGFDANWEGGLKLAAARATDAYKFLEAASPDDIRFSANDRFTLAVCMETLEHVPPNMVDGYLRKIAEHLDGWFFVTVPNERGIVFLTKWLAKKLWYGSAEAYTFAELINATLGRMDCVARHEHKGFDWSRLVEQVAMHFDVVEVSGFPVSVLPKQLCLTIGIAAKSRPAGGRE